MPFEILQLIAGLRPACEVTDPAPGPLPDVVSVCVVSEKVAVTLRACVITTRHWFGLA